MFAFRTLSVGSDCFDGRSAMGSHCYMALPFCPLVHDNKMKNFLLASLFEKICNVEGKVIEAKAR